MAAYVLWAPACTEADRFLDDHGFLAGCSTLPRPTGGRTLTPAESGSND